MDLSLKTNTLTHITSCLILHYGYYYPPIFLLDLAGLENNQFCVNRPYPHDLPKYLHFQVLGVNPRHLYLTAPKHPKSKAKQAKD